MRISIISSDDNVVKSIAIHISRSAYGMAREIICCDTINAKSITSIKNGKIHGWRKSGRFSENDIA